MPIWVWGFVGICLSSAAATSVGVKFPHCVSAIWGVTLLLGADETVALKNLTRNSPEIGSATPIEGVRPIRVITLNAASFTRGDPTDDLAAWDPDIVILQEVFPFQTRQIATALFGETGDFRCHSTNGIITRWEMTREVTCPLPNFQNFNHNVTVRLPDQRQVEIANLHLTTAATDLRLWQRQAWVTHRDNRRKRSFDLELALTIIDKTNHPLRPVIIGGDFNSPPGGPVHELLKPDYDDVFRKVGTGWGNTYHRRVPILRIDRLFVNSGLQPVRCCAATTRASDHRMVIADLLLR